MFQSNFECARGMYDYGPDRDGTERCLLTPYNGQPEPEPQEMAQGRVAAVVIMTTPPSPAHRTRRQLKPQRDFLAKNAVLDLCRSTCRSSHHVAGKFQRIGRCLTRFGRCFIVSFILKAPKFMSIAQIRGFWVENQVVLKWLLITRSI